MCTMLCTICTVRSHHSAWTQCQLAQAYVAQVTWFTMNKERVTQNNSTLDSYMPIWRGSNANATIGFGIRQKMCYEAAEMLIFFIVLATYRATSKL
eukprot:1212159-Amphidinium_carterae.1